MGIYDEYFEEFNKVVSDHLEIDIKLFYPPVFEACPNCITETFGGEVKSLGIYNGSGPLPFSDTICPYCDGNGKKSIESFEIIRARAYTKNKDNMNDFVNIPNAELMIITNLNNLNKLKNAAYISPQDGMQNHEFYQFINIKSSIKTGFALNPVKMIQSFWAKHND